jgi:L-fuculose-phosphate aldolase
MADVRERLAALCRLAYDRHLLDSAGGNLTVREGDRVYMSPRYAGSKRQWQLNAEDFLVVDLEGAILAGSGELSREATVHLAIYRTFDDAGCVFHAHASNIMVFVSAGVPLPPSSEITDEFGTIGFCEWAPSHTEALAANVVAGLEPMRSVIPQHPIATLVPRHGIFVTGKDLDSTYDALERIDRGARMHLLARLLRQIGP